MNSKRAALVLTLAATAARAQSPDPQPDYAELVAQVKALQAQVNQLQAKQANYVSAADVDATVRRVMEDADRRSRFLDVQGMTAGWNGERFVIRSDDGKFSLSPVLVIQERYVANYRQSVPGTTKTDAIEDGFENRRLRFGVDGSFITENLTYKFILAADRGTAVASTDAYIQYQFIPDWSVRVGQFKDFWTHEENISDVKQLAADRSLTNALIGGGNTNWVQGVDLLYTNSKPLSAQLALHDGANSRETSFRDTPATTEAPLLGTGDVDYGVSGRVNFFAIGDPAEYADYTALNNKSDLLVFGAGADFTQAGDNQALFHSADVQWENTRGTSAFAEYVGLYRQINTASTGATGVNAGDFYDYGVVLQLGQMISPKCELFARYDWTQLDDAAFTPTRSTQETQIQEITAGTNYYIFKHNCKLTVDLSYLPNGSPDAPGLGYIASDANSFVFRTQLNIAL